METTADMEWKLCGKTMNEKRQEKRKGAKTDWKGHGKGANLQGTGKKPLLWSNTGVLIRTDADNLVTTASTTQPEQRKPCTLFKCFVVFIDFCSLSVVFVVLQSSSCSRPLNWKTGRSGSERTTDY